MFLYLLICELILCAEIEINFVVINVLISKPLLVTSRTLNGIPGANDRRRILTIVHQKPGPLQTIFNLLPDEARPFDSAAQRHLQILLVYILLIVNLFQVVDHSYSCALERSFLYHGRMYVSAWHICFHSNVFSKQIKVSSQWLMFNSFR